MGTEATAAETDDVHRREGVDAEPAVAPSPPMQDEIPPEESAPEKRPVAATQTAAEQVEEAAAQEIHYHYHLGLLVGAAKNPCYIYCHYHYIEL
jgi:hypothetical protein